jgi:hypothetical protein
MKRLLLAAAAMILLFGSSVYAAEGEADSVADIIIDAPELAETIPLTSGPLARATTFLGSHGRQLHDFANDHPGLAALSMVYVTANVLDWDSTMRAVGRGGTEQNPVMGAVAGNSAAYLALKSALTATTLYAVNRVWQKNRPAAVVMLAGVTVAQGFIVAHNYSLTTRR